MCILHSQVSLLLGSLLLNDKEDAVPDRTAV